MKAAIFKSYGGPESIQVQQIDKPTPGDKEILINVKATTVTAVDSIFRKGESFFPRLATGLFNPKIRVLGTELSGIVEEVGIEVSDFKPGDEVIADSGTNYGSHAEFVCISKDDPIVLKPDNISFKEAAAISYGALTALPFLRDKGKIKSGQKVLVIGASGSVGTYAVQLAQHYDTEVTGVCSSKNIELVKSLGADHVIDYHTTSFNNLKASYDIVFDTVGKYSFDTVQHLLSSQGIYLTTFLSIRSVFDMLVTKFSGNKKSILSLTGLRSGAVRKKDLQYIVGLFKNEDLKVVIDKEYSLDNISDAFQYVDQGHKTGNVVIVI